MSEETYEALERAVMAHTADETGGDLAVDWVVCVSAANATDQHGTTYGYTAFGGYEQHVPVHRMTGLLDIIKEQITRD